eukprot:TRINITY_DN1412_c0_g1_i4.p3 TRINITY_DN1412_c0_g1~~TRINITY_DN1412_c0_g1_i4.p3  ORF type:complete len:104 (+),score=39.59 TRINITY_DN1412_c0_g1_i4:347-658(+)
MGFDEKSKGPAGKKQMDAPQGSMEDDFDEGLSGKKEKGGPQGPMKDEGSQEDRFSKPMKGDSFGDEYMATGDNRKSDNEEVAGKKKKSGSYGDEMEWQYPDMA